MTPSGHSDQAIGEGAGGGGGAVLNDARWLAAGAGGLLAALAALWALRGLPLGAAMFWLVPLPLFATGLGFGVAALAGAAAVAALALMAAAGGVALVVVLAAFGVPVALLVALGLRGPRLELARPLAVLGLWPAVVILLAAVALADVPGGLEGAMRIAVEAVLAQAGLRAPPEVVDTWVRLKAPTLALVVAVALVANAAAAQRLLERRGLALAAAPRWSEARLPAWYPVLPALALGAWVAAPEERDTVALSVLLTLLVPVFLQGVAGVHAAARARAPAGGGRRGLLVLFYALLLFPWTSAPAVLSVTALGLLVQWRRPGAAPPPSSPGGKT